MHRSCHRHSTHVKVRYQVEDGGNVAGQLFSKGKRKGMGKGKGKSNDEDTLMPDSDDSNEHFCDTSRITAESCLEVCCLMLSGLILFNLQSTVINLHRAK